VQAVTAGDCASTDPAGAGGCQVLVRTHDQATGATADWLVSSDGGVDRAAPSARFVGVTSLAGSGTEVGLTRVRQDGSSCSGIAGQSGPVAWQTCSHTLLAFSPDGSYVSGDTAYHDGAGSSVLAAYGANGDLAFDHLQIVRDAVERARMELEVTGIATAFVGPTFTLAELRAVYEAIWGVQLDAANFRRSVVTEEGWVIPTGRRSRPGSSGGRPAELYKPGKAWRHGGPIHRAQRPDERK